ncbi:MAG: disulfide isomerase DsbC N-terminal domain-containing protein [Chloroflexota bacterium]
MQLIVFALTLAALLLPVTGSHAFSEKGQDCAKCHTLSKEDALSLLKDFGQNLKVLEVRQGPASGMWEVDVDAGGKKGLVYVHYSKNYVLFGELYDLKAKKSVTRERLLEINKVDVSQIPLDDALVMGEKDAKYKVIVFDDPD